MVAAIGEILIIINSRKVLFSPLLIPENCRLYPIYQVQANY
jgi:hypothetical protein